MDRSQRFPLGVVVIAVIMIFAAVGIDAHWLMRALGKSSSVIPVSPEVYRASVYPDLVLSLLLYAGAYGLLRLRRFGFILTLVAMGMWISDALFVFGLTGSAWISFLGPSLLFASGSVWYLWRKKIIFH